MDGLSSISAIEQKMAKMRVKNLELLKRHQEIEEDRQQAERTGAAATTITIVEPAIETTMRGATKTRTRTGDIHHNPPEAQYERVHRQAVRRKFDNERVDTQQPQRAQWVDYNRLKRHDAVNQQQQNNNNSISPELLEYAYPFHYRSENNNNNNNDADEPAHAKKLVIVNNKADRIGSGRFGQQQQQQQQRTQDKGQRRREERMRRCGVQNNGHTGPGTEFHLDVPQMPIWQNGPMPPPPPMHMQYMPTTMNGHHTGVDHLMNSGGDQMEQSPYLHNFVYSSPAQPTPYNNNGTVYFAQPPPPMTAGPPSCQAAPPQGHFHQFHPTRTFENSNRHQFHQHPHFQSSPVFQPPPPPPAVVQQQDEPPNDMPPRFRRLQIQDHDELNHRAPPVQQRPMSGDFDRLQNGYHPSSFSSLRNNNDNRFQSRPQSFYDISSQQQQQQQQSNGNNNNNFFRPSNNRYQRNHYHQQTTNTNNSLPLSAYMNTDDSSSYQNGNHWNGQQQQLRRRMPQSRVYHQDKHQFPLSSYDPRQYGFTPNYQRRHDYNGHATRSNPNRRGMNNAGRNHLINDSNDFGLIEEWWEDDNNTELIGDTQQQQQQQQTINSESQTNRIPVDDSGNSSLSTSMNLKESTLDDEETNLSTHDVVSPPSDDISTTDSNIIESLDKLQQQLKLEEAVDEQLAAAAASKDADAIDSELFLSTKELPTYDTAHFMQWAKEKFREELAGRLTAQEIQQHDAVTTDDEDDVIINSEKLHIEQTTDDDNHSNTGGVAEEMDALEGDLNGKLTLEENATIPNQAIAVE